MKTLKNVGLLSIALTLTACANNSTLSSALAEKITNTQTSQQSEKLVKLENKARGLKHFQYIHNAETYDVYSSSQPELIQVSTPKGINKFFYQNGKLIATQDSKGVKLFNAEQKATPEVLKKAQLFLNLFSYNNADKGVGRVNTGDEAKLNYLCISKIQQVAQTKRVFRSPEGATIKADSLKGTVRLNGNQYYQLECKIADNQVSKLSLISK